MKCHAVPIVILSLICMGAIGLILTLPSAPCKTINVKITQIIVEDKPLYRGSISEPDGIIKPEKFPVEEKYYEYRHALRTEKPAVLPILPPSTNNEPSCIWAYDPKTGKHHKLRCR